VKVVTLRALGTTIEIGARWLLAWAPSPDL